MSDLDAIRVIIDGNASDLRRATREAVRDIRDVAQEVRRASAETRLSNVQTDQAGRSYRNMGVEVQGTAQHLRNFGVSLRAIAWGSAIANTAPLAAGLADIAAGATAAGAALAPLAGSVAALPGLFAAGAQGMGVLALATHNLGKAMAGNQKALDSLTPAAREFLGTLRSDLGPEIKKLQATAQAGLFPGLVKGLKAAEPALRPLNKIVGDTAKQLGGLGQRLGEMVGSKAWTKDIATLGARNVKVIGSFGDAGLHLADALRNIVLAAGPLVNWMARSTDAISKNVDQWTKGARASGELADFFKLVRERITQTVDVLKNFGEVIFNVLRAAQPLANALMNALVGVSGHLAAITGSVAGQNALGKFFADAQGPLEAVGKLLGSLVAAIFDLAQKGQADLKQLADTLRVDVLPVLHEALAAIATQVLPHVIDLLGAVGRLLHSILPGLKPILAALGGILDVLRKIVDKLTQWTDELPGVAKLIPTLAVSAAVLASWSELVKLSRLVVFGNAASGVVSGLAGGVAGGIAGGIAAGAGPRVLAGGAIERASGLVIPAGVRSVGIDAAAGAAGAGGFFATGGLKGLATRLLPKAVRFGGPIAAAGTVADVLGNPAVAGITKSPDLSKFIAQAKDGAPTVQALVKQVNALADAQHHLAFEASPDAAKKINDTVDALKGWLQPARNVQSAIQTLASSGGKSMGLLKQDFKNALREIEIAEQLGVINAQQSATATSQAYGALAKAILGHMRDAGKFTQQGMDQITAAVKHEFAVLGIKLTDKQAQRYGTGNDTLTGKPLNGSNAGGGFAVGGFIGSPGEAGADNVPVVLGRGEAVLNRHQQAPVNAALQMAYGTDLGGLFSSMTKPHYMASGGYAGFFPASGTNYSVGSEPQIAARLDRLAHALHLHLIGLSGYRSPQHSVSVGGFPNDPHTRGQASDTPGVEGVSESVLERFGLTRPFGGAAEADHIQLFGGGSGGAVPASVSAAIKRVKFPKGMGLLSVLGQGALDKVRGAAQKKLDATGGSVGSGSGGVPGASGGFGLEALADLWKRAGGPANVAALMAHVAIAESSGNPNAHNASGATGLWQILGAVVKGNLYDPLVNARNAVAKYRAGGLAPWTASRGVWGKYVGKSFASGGYVASAASAGDSIIGLGQPLPSKKAKAKKKSGGSRASKPTSGVNPNNGKVESHSPSVWHTIRVAYQRKQFLKSHIVGAVKGAESGSIPDQLSGRKPITYSGSDSSSDLTVNEQAFLDFFDGQLAMADLDTPFVAFDPSLSGDSPFDPATGLPALHNPAALDDDLLWAGRKAFLLTNIYADRKVRNAPVAAQGRIAAMVKQARSDLEALQAEHDAKQIPLAADTSVRDSLLATQRDNALSNLALSNQQLGVLSGFAPLLAGRFVGSFASGTVSVPRDGLAMVHQGEAILPNPKGPYGSQIPTPAASNTHNIEVHVHGDGMDSLIRRVDVMVDGKIQQAQHAQGRRARLFASAAGAQR
jgi:hypothetical protein